MKKNTFFRIQPFISAGIIAIWIAGFLLFQNSSPAASNYWKGFTFGLLGLVVTSVGFLLRTQGNQGTEETGYLSVCYSVLFSVILILLNLFFSFTKGTVFTSIFIVINLMILLAYIVLCYFANRHCSRVTQLTEYAAEKTARISAISQELSILSGICTDERVKQLILRLKEKVDFSSNVSQASSTDIEELLLQKLHDIRDALSSGANTETLIDQMKEASIIWDKRNSQINTIK